MTEVKEIISKNLRKYRLQARMSQTELARQLGISPSSVSNWEQGLNSIDVDTLFRVCKILKVSISMMAKSPDDDNVELYFDNSYSVAKTNLLKKVESMNELQAVAALEIFERLDAYAHVLSPDSQTKKYKQVGQNRFRNKNPDN